MGITQRIVFLSLLLVQPAQVRAQSALLSNNISPGVTKEGFPQGTRVIPTRMHVTWITNGVYATDAESVKTGRGEDGKSKALFDGNAAGGWKSQSYSEWGGGVWNTITVDLGEEYAIDKIDTWALHAKARDTDYVEVLFSSDGALFTPHGAARSTNIPLQDKQFVPLTLQLERPVLSRHVQLRIHRRKTAWQQQISEIAIWGEVPRSDIAYLKADDRPRVSFRVRGIQAGVALIDWREFHELDAGVTEWRVYMSQTEFANIDSPGVRLFKSVSGKTSQTTIYPLEPDHEYYFGVTAVYPAGEYPYVSPMHHKTPAPLSCATLGDMVAINHFWGGGAHRKSHGENQESYENVALDLLAQSGIDHVRWWVVSPDIYEKFYARGIGLYSYSHGDNLKRGLALGVYAYAGAGNEPDLGKGLVQTYVGKLKEIYEKKQSLNPKALICAPSSGLEDTSIEWLDSFYALGSKEWFDVLDLHTYCKLSGGHKQPDGYPAGAPEAMFDNMRKVRAVLEKYGDTVKPVISTEFGYTEATTGNPSGSITPLVKAQYLARGLIIHHVLGFNRVFLYSFWDSGSDINFTEDLFGLIDFDLQKKPAFFAVRNLIDVLGECRLVGELPSIVPPSFGYQYGDASQEATVSVIWDGTGLRRGVFRTEAESVEVIGMFRDTEHVAVGPEGTFPVHYGPSPVYLRASAPIVYVSSERVPDEASANVSTSGHAE